LLLLLFVAVTGCQKGRKEVPTEETRIKNLATVRGQYIGKNKGQLPPNVDALKAFAKTLSPEQLKGFGVEGDVDQLFVSPRDNEPYVYRFVKEGGVPGVGANVVVFYEKTGKNGKRWVAYSTTQIEEVDEKRFKELVPEAP